jgi:hypothetical protein
MSYGEDLDAGIGVATTIALRVGLLERCPYCEDVYDPMSDEREAAYKLANSLISRQDPLVHAFASDRRALTDLLQDVTSNYSDLCGCKQLSDD